MSKFLSVDEVVERLFDDDFSFSEGNISDEEGEPMLENHILTPRRWQL